MFCMVAATACSNQGGPMSADEGSAAAAPPTAAEMSALETADIRYNTLLANISAMKSKEADLARSAKRAKAAAAEAKKDLDHADKFWAESKGAEDIQELVPLIEEIARIAVAGRNSQECAAKTMALAGRIETVVTPWVAGIREESDRKFRQTHYRADSDSNCLGEIDPSRQASMTSITLSDVCNHLADLAATPPYSLPANLGQTVQGHVRESDNASKACLGQAFDSPAIGEAGLRVAIFDKNLRNLAVAASLRQIAPRWEADAQLAASKVASMQDRIAKAKARLPALKPDHDRYVAIMAPVWREQQAVADARKRAFDECFMRMVGNDAGVEACARASVNRAINEQANR